MMKLASLASLSLSLSLLALGACGSDDDKQPVVEDSGVRIDTATGDPDATSTACTLAPSLSALTMIQAFHTADDPATTDEPEGYYRLEGALNADPAPDRLILELTQGAPLFDPSFPSPTPQNPTVIQLMDEEECSACLRAETDVPTSGEDEGLPVDEYVPTAGTLTLTALSARKVTGTLTGVMLVQIDFDTGEPHASGCRATLADVPFDVVPMDEPGLAPVRARQDRKLLRR